MEILYLEKTKEIRNNKQELEKKLNVEITISGRKITVSGEAINEYEAEMILGAIGFGFSAKKALLLKDEEMIFIKIPIKSYTKRKDMKTIRGRIIGRKGKTKKTLEDLTNSFIVVNNNEVGVIGDAESVEETKTAITNLIRGSKEANVYRFLEEMNAAKKELNYKK